MSPLFISLIIIGITIGIINLLASEVMTRVRTRVEKKNFCELKFNWVRFN
jgi:hypothetical protein